MSENEYTAKAMKLLNRVKSLVNCTDWELVSDTDGIKLESKEYPDICPILCYRVNGMVPKSTEELIDMVWNVTEKSNKEEDPDILEWKIVESGDNWRVCSQINKMQWPLWSREVVFSQVKIIEPNTSWLLSFSVDHDKQPEDDTKYVRAVVHMNVFRFEKVGNNTRVWKFSHIDPSGYIPVAVINLYASKLIQVIKKWQ